MRFYRHIFLWLLSCSVGFAQLPTKSKTDNEVSSLLTVYGDWREAVNARDLAKWKANTARYRQRMVENIIRSLGGEYPQDALSDLNQQLPDPASLHVIKKISNAHSAVLVAVYTGQLDSGGSGILEKPWVRLFFLRSGSSDSWHFDRIQVGKKDDAGALAAVLPDQPPRLPILCPIPFFISDYALRGVGCQVDVRINGFSQDGVQDGENGGVLIGGLHNGINQVSLKITPLPHASANTNGGASYVELALYARHERLPNRAVRVYHYKRWLNLSGKVKNVSNVFRLSPTELVRIYKSNNQSKK